MLGKLFGKKDELFVDNKVHQKVLVSVYDSVACHYDIPIVSDNLDSAKRLFRDICMSPGIIVSQHPEDFSLCHIGYYDDKTGFVVSIGQPVSIARARDFFNNSSHSTTISEVQKSDSEEQPEES